MLKKILFIDDETNICRTAQEIFEDHGWQVYTCGSLSEARGILNDIHIEIIVVDKRLSENEDGVIFAKELAADAQVVVLTAHGEISDAVEAIKHGVKDYLTKPVHWEALFNKCEQLQTEIELRRELEALKVSSSGQMNEMIGKSLSMRQLNDEIQKIAAVSNATVLITGESGTGKELVARAIHHYTLQRCRKPFVAVNCGAIAGSLLESELFGYEKGAFTGASALRKGRFELANGGTIFLDEIGETSPETQVKFLRVLEQKSFLRVGGQQKVSVDIRIIAATHRDLQAEIRKGRFREDLYYRLKTFPIKVPPLRDRKTDIKRLITYFLTKFNKEIPHRISEISDAALERLQNYTWPGNIRELENLMLRLIILFRNISLLDVYHLEKSGFSENHSQSISPLPVPAAVLPPRKLPDSLFYRMPNGKKLIRRLEKPLGESVSFKELLIALGMLEQHEMPTQKQMNCLSSAIYRLNLQLANTGYSIKCEKGNGYRLLRDE